MRCRLVVFQNGRRIERGYEDHRLAAPIAKKLQRKGVKYRIVASKVLDRYKYPPLDDDLEMHRDEGKWWCPFCRDWSFFKVPKFTPNAEIGSTEWYLNGAHRQGLRVCAWCLITEMEFYVRMANGEWDRPRRRRRKRRVR
jgi:hypothetical protein